MAKIIIVDDEPMIRSYLRKCLENGYHRVFEFTNSDDALRAQRESPADLVITDIFMPGQDGLQAIMRLHDEDPNLPIIAMSGGATGRGGPTCTAMLGSAEMFGAINMLEKPFTAEQLHEAVSAALAR
jgi:DNA-binding NtrC family response regulator